MFGIRYIKTQPTTHLMQFRRGRIAREGAGLSFFYYAPASTLVAVPVGSQEGGFMLELVTADYQSVTVQGQVTYRVADPRRTAALMDFSLASDGTYVSEDPARLRDRVVMQLEVIVQQAIQVLDLKQALKSSAAVAQAAQDQLAQQTEIQALGLEILGVSVVAIKPTPDISRALEAQAREAHLKAADEAIYQRRMGAVENERAIRQNELDTEIAVEEKKRQIQGAQMDARAAVLQRENELRGSQMGADIELEERRKTLVASQAENTRSMAEAEAHRVRAVMAALEHADPRVVQALAAAGMQPGQLIAQAFGGIAEKAERIGQLNVSPELLNALVGNAVPVRRGAQ
jgi:regulator of protease activity HflC (stomatin/prohibitin superfamily)